MIFISIFLLSLSSLTFEVLLTRVFSINQWNHLSFMVISIALFGFAAGGTFLSILDTCRKGWQTRLADGDAVSVFILLYTAGTMASFLVLNNLPLDYFKLPLEPMQSVYLLTAFVLLAVPFFFAGLVISITYAALPENTGYAYCASMAGSACGAVLPAATLPFVDEGKLIILAAAVPLMAVPFLLRGGKHSPRQKPPRSQPKGYALQAAGLFLIVIGYLLINSPAARFIFVQPSAYKALSQAVRLPDTSITGTRNSIRGRTDEITSPYIRYAPGISLKFTDRLPAQRAVFRDGDTRLVVYQELTRQNAAFATYTLPFAGYFMVSNPDNVLLIQNGGGLSPACAKASGAKTITVVDQNPDYARFIARNYRVPVVNRNFREFLSQTNQRYDIIHIENWGTSLTGSAALNQEYFFSVESLKEYLAHLTARGVLIIARKLLLPPSDSLRLWATAHEALTADGIVNPEKHIALLRNWDTYTLLVFRSPIRTGERLIDFAGDRNFDLVFLPGLDPKLANRYAIFDAPYHYFEINQMYQAYSSGQKAQYFKAYPLDVAPQNDDRPFPARILKWHRLTELYQSMGSRLYALLMSSEIVIAVVLLEAFLITALLLGLPLLTVRKSGGRPSGIQIGYFLAVGAGFMFVELYFIKQFILLFGNPVISFTVVLAGMLIFSSIGGLISQRMQQRGLMVSLVMLTGALATFYLGAESILHKMLSQAEIWRYILSVVMLAPAGILVGFPFPLGMRCFLHSPVARTYAWTANGCTSVLAAIVSAQIALSLGISYIMLAALASYAVALICACSRRVKQQLYNKPAD
jgi:hypothetical protein